MVAIPRTFTPAPAAPTLPLLTRLAPASAAPTGHCASKTGDQDYPGLTPEPIGTVRAVSKVSDLEYALTRDNGTVPETAGAAPYKVGDRVRKTGPITGVTCESITAITAKAVVARTTVFPGYSCEPFHDQSGDVIGITSRANMRLDIPPIAAIGDRGMQLPTSQEGRFVRADRIGSTPATR